MLCSPVVSYGGEIIYDKFNNEFDKMQVQMVDGEKVRLGSLPWFQLALGVHKGRHAWRANSADWVIASPPGHCVYDLRYWFTLGRPLTDRDIKKAVDPCNKAVSRRMEGATPAQIDACKCRPVLKSKWSVNYTYFSGDDDLLRTGAWNYPVEISGDGQSLYGLISISPNGIFIKNYDGVNVCSLGEARGNGYRPTPEIIIALLSRDGAPGPNKCFGGKKSGNISVDVQYIFREGRVNGTGEIKFDDGEVLNVVFGD